MRIKRNGFILIELILAIALLAAVAVPVYMATNTYLKVNSATQEEIRLQASAQTIMERFEKAMRSSDSINDLTGSVNTNSIPINNGNRLRSEWLSATDIRLSAGTFLLDEDDILSFSGRRVADPLIKLEIALILNEPRTKSLNLNTDGDEILGLAVRLHMKEDQSSYILSRDFLFRNLNMPAPSSGENQSDLLIGDDESFYFGNGFPLHFKMSPVDPTASMKNQNQLLIFLKPSLEFDDNQESLVTVIAPVISIQYLSDRGIPDNKNNNRITVRVGQYTTSEKNKRVSTWTDDVDYKNLSLDWKEDSLEVNVSVNQSGFYQVEISRATDIGSQLLLSHTTRHQPLDNNDYALYLGDGFGNNKPGNVATNNDIAAVDPHPDSTGVWEIDFLN
jgi:type II secretory pathway pseudopilin PulG